MNKELQTLLNAEQVAEILAIPVSTLKKNVSQNPESVPPPIRLGNAKNSPLRWIEEDVMAWIEERRGANHSARPNHPPMPDFGRFGRDFSQKHLTNNGGVK